MWRVAGDGNCGYYSCIISCDGVSALHHVRSRRRPSAHDYQKQQKLSEDCVGWLLQKEQLALCKHEQLGKVRADGKLKESFERDNSEIQRHLRGKQSAGARSGEYAKDICLRAMAAHKQVYLVTINTATLKDSCTVYPPEGGSSRTVVASGLSWAEEIVPMLLRQQRNPADPPYRVILYNGARDATGHFDATGPS